jgi:DNA invertase Pin-like site-specific DNA recombinase
MNEHIAQAEADSRPVVRLTLEGEQGELLALLRKLAQPTKSGRRPGRLSAGAVEEILRRLAAGEAKAALAREFGVSVQTVRRAWQNRKKEG